MIIELANATVSQCKWLEIGTSGSSRRLFVHCNGFNSVEFLQLSGVPQEFI